MEKYSLLKLFNHARSYHENWQRAWRSPTPKSDYDVVIVGGGGSRNPTLMSMIQGNLHSTTVMSHEGVGMNSDFKEALVFAILGHETWHGRANTYPFITGVNRPTVLGSIVPGDNYVNLVKDTWSKSVGV